MKKIITLVVAVVMAFGIATAQSVLVDYDFNNGDKTGLSIYDVDNNTPSSFMQQIGFTTGNTWILIKDSNTSTDMFLGSTSQYVPAAQANDWLVLPAIDITGKGYVLEWKSQAFYANKRDGLKVFISTEGGLPENFPATPVWEVEEEEIGATEDYFEGEFIAHSISLDDYVGKRIYIAFVNQSYDKSLLCIDDIKVCSKESFSIDLDLERVVYEQDEITFSGTINNWTVDKIEQVDFYLKYNGNEYSEALQNLDLTPGESAEFTLSHKAPIALNEKLDYSIIASTYNAGSSNDASNIITEYISSVTNVFRRRVVIEDHTGVWCENCPAGIWGLDSLKEVAPDNIAPISVQNNNGIPNPRLVVDAYDAGLSGAGCTQFPSGWVNRTYIEHPWGNGSYNFDDEKSWVSLFYQIMEEVPEAGISVTGYFNANRTYINARASVRTAELKDNLDWRIVYVLTEDSVTGFYQNNKYSGMSTWVGGWESRPRNVSVVFNDIARGIYPSFYGEKGSMPSTIAVGDVAEYTYGIAVPYTAVDSKGNTVEIIQDADKLNLIAMLVDGTTNRVVNAAMVRVSDVPEAVEGVVGDALQARVWAVDNGVNVSTGQDVNFVATMYSVDGRVIATTDGKGEAILSAAGYKGVAIVQVVSEGVAHTAKVVIR